MKMTKAIREFIEEQVAEAANTSTDATLAKLKAEADDATQRWNDALEAKREQFNTELAFLAKDFGYAYVGYNGKEYLPHTCGFDSCHAQYLPAVKAYNEAKAEIKRKIDKSIKDIVVSMELGGTKKELMEMISKLEF